MSRKRTPLATGNRYVYEGFPSGFEIKWFTFAANDGIPGVAVKWFGGVRKGSGFYAFKSRSKAEGTSMSKLTDAANDAHAMNNSGEIEATDIEGPASESSAEADAPAGLKGRELDAWIAEHLMRWVWFTFAGTDYLTPDYLAQKFREHRAWGFREGRRGVKTEELAEQFQDYSHAKIPRFSEDIAAAMEVVEKVCAALPLKFVCTREPDSNLYFLPAAEQWEARFYSQDINITDANVSVKAATLPEAICRAAIQASATALSLAGVEDDQNKENHDQS